MFPFLRIGAEKVQEVYDKIPPASEAESDGRFVEALYLPNWLIIEDNTLKLVDDGLVDEELSEDLDIEISLSVSDGELETVKNLNLIVEAVNDAPLFKDEIIYSGG